MHSQRKSIFTTALILLSTCGSIHAKDSIPENIKLNIKSRADYGLLNGIVVGYADKNGISFFSHGQLSKDSNQAVDKKTLFEIGSITKTFTTTLIAEASYTKLIDVNSSINNYLPPQAKNEALNDIRIVDITNHHSGLPRMPDNFAPVDNNNPYADYSITDLYEFLRDINSHDIEPNVYEYSNLGLGLAGHILELIYKRPYPEIISNHLLTPLGMTSTYARFNQQLSPMAQGHNGSSVSNWTFQALNGAGGIISNAEDMMQYLLAQTKFNHKTLTPSFQKARQAFRRDIASNMNVAMAWFIKQESKSSDIIYHDGNTNGYWSFAGFLEDGSKAVVVLSNSGTEDVNDIGFHLLNANNQLTEAPTVKEVDVSASVLADYIGKYQSPEGLLFNVTAREKQLFVALNDQAEFSLFPTSNNEFHYRALRAKVLFNKEQQSLTLIQDGEHYTAIKQ